jgi:ABC-type Mn2+/Zn2+ transport system ATPase subunit
LMSQPLGRILEPGKSWSLCLPRLLDAGTAIVAVTHDAQFVEALADREFCLSAPNVSGAESRVVGIERGVS